MPTISDPNTQKAIARAFIANGRDKSKALIEIGYKDTYALSGHCAKLYERSDLKQAIRAEEQKIAKKYEHNQDIAIKLLLSDYANLEQKAINGDIQAIQARTAIIRELNAITGQHSSTLITDAPKPKPLTPEELEVLQAQAIELTKPRLAHTGT